MPWAVYDPKTGALVSVGSVVADNLGERGLAAKFFDREISPFEVWDPSKLDFVLQPKKYKQQSLDLASYLVDRIRSRFPAVPFDILFDLIAQVLEDWS